MDIEKKFSQIERICFSYINSSPDDFDLNADIVEEIADGLSIVLNASKSVPQKRLALFAIYCMCQEILYDEKT